MELDESYSYQLQYWFLVGPWQGSFAPPEPVPAAPVAPQPLGCGAIPPSPSGDSRLGTSPCTGSAAGPWGWSSQRTSRGTSGHGPPLPAGVRTLQHTGSRAGLLPRPRFRDTHHGRDGGCRSSPMAPPFPSSPNVCATYSCPWKIYGAAVSISPALY